MAAGASTTFAPVGFVMVIGEPKQRGAGRDFGVRPPKYGGRWLDLLVVHSVVHPVRR